MTNPKSIYLPIAQGSVLTIKQRNQGSLFNDDAILASTILERIQQRLTDRSQFSLNYAAGDLIIGEGIDCNLLVPGCATWTSGKLKLVLEFVPDEPEIVKESPVASTDSSPLDSIRQGLLND